MADLATILYGEKLQKTVRNEFENDGTILRLRGQLHTRIIKMLRGLQGAPLCAINDKKPPVMDSRLVLLNQLVMEYFDWFGYKHTMETFAIETNMPTKPAARSEMEAKLGKFELKELPILMEMLIRLLASKLCEADADSGAVKASEVAVAKVIPVKITKTDKATTRYREPKQSVNDLTCQNVKEFKKKFCQSRPTSQYVNQQPKPAATALEHNFYVNANEDHTSESPESSDSDLFAEVPEGHYYEELEPPEQAYPHGFGEEGPLASHYYHAAKSSSIAKGQQLTNTKNNATLKFHSPNQWPDSANLAKAHKKQINQKISKTKTRTRTCSRLVISS